MRRFLRNPGGFTMIEILAVLGIIAVLAAVMAPSVVKHITDAKRTRATHECEVIATATASFYKDMGFWPTHNDADHRPQDQEVRLLRTNEGTTPSEVAGVGWLTLNPQDTFDNQLIANTPNGNAANAYTTSAENRWQGPYLLRFKCDPWGNKYLCNVRAFHQGQTGPAWVISAGPDGEIDTNVASLTLADDDIGYLLKR